MMRKVKGIFAVATAAIGLTALTAQAQQPEVAVVDIQEIIENFYKTPIEEKKINDEMEPETKPLEVKVAKLREMGEQFKTEQEKLRAEGLSDEDKKAIGQTLEKILKERQPLQAEVMRERAVASQKLVKLRRDMEQRMLGEIKDMISAVADKNGIDFVVDKSFLPKSKDKLVLYVSAGMTDMTDVVIQSLNATKP
ncbi:MAG: OmpH family outer membrane protein [Verrucomicrobiota bacterium]